MPFSPVAIAAWQAAVNQLAWTSGLNRAACDRCTHARRHAPSMAAMLTSVRTVCAGKCRSKDFQPRRNGGREGWLADTGVTATPPARHPGTPPLSLFEYGTC